MHTIKKLALKNNARFFSCISKINNTLIDNAEDLDMLMYNLPECSKNYRIIIKYKIYKIIKLLQR